MFYRLAATGSYLFFMGLTLFLAFYPNTIPLRLLWLIISIVCQFCCLIWYSLSYIPFANEILKSILRQICCSQCQQCDCNCFGEERSTSTSSVS